MVNEKNYAGKKLTEIAYPIGGIGTGSISIGGWGNLKDFEIMNRPAKGFTPERTFFSVYAKESKGKPDARIIMSPPQGSLSFPHGYSNSSGIGLRHFFKNDFCSAFPFAKLNFYDSDFILDVSLEVFNPFIPLNSDDSSIPVVIFLIKLSNKSKNKTNISLCFSMENFIGYPEKGRGIISFKKSANDKLKGLYFKNNKYNIDSAKYGSIAISTNHYNTLIQTMWKRGKWFDGIQLFWEKFSEYGEIYENFEKAEAPNNINDIASICLKDILNNKETKIYPIYLTWFFPNYEKYFSEEPQETYCCNNQTKPIWKNYYATLFKDAWEIAKYVNNNFIRLESESRKFSKTFFSSTLPNEVLDAVSANLTTLKSTTCIRLEDGSFYAFEGCHNDSGCCHGTCSHVWNYAQSHAYLFPDIARNIRENDYKYNMDKDGHINFRATLPLNTNPQHNFHAAADGQLGGIIQTYREWLISGDNDWLKSIWNKLKLALDYTFKFWDYNKDGIIEGVQHNTYDIEFHGPNSMIGTLYLCALKCAEKIALYFNELEYAKKYEYLFKKGSEWIDKNLFNGEYYIQKINKDAWKYQPDNMKNAFKKNINDNIDPKMKIPKYQYMEGCLSDQLIGEWYASMLNLPNLLNKKNIIRSLKSIFKYNWHASLIKHSNTQRIYAIDEEQGLILCSWKDKNNRPTHPFPYSDEVWTGIEYEVASLMIYYGFIDEGLKIVRGVRKRHDGERRNPFNEFECGNHYARALSSYSLILALSGFYYSAPDCFLSLSPKISTNNFKCFFSVNSGWGIISKQDKAKKVELLINVKYGFLVLKRIEADYNHNKPKTIYTNGLERSNFKFKYSLIDNRILIEFDEIIKIKSEDEHSSLKIIIKY